MSIQLGNLAIVSGTDSVFQGAPREGVKAILIGNESGLTITITMQGGQVQKTLYPSTVDWFAVNQGFNGNILIHPVTVLNNVSSWPASTLVFDAIGLNDPEHAAMYPVTLIRTINIGNVLTTVAAGSAGSSAPVTPLVLYGSSVASTTLSTADQLAIAAGGVETSNSIGDDNIFTLSGYLEFLSHGGTPTGFASIQSPTGNGWLYDSIALEGKTIQTGPWSGAIAMSHSFSVSPDFPGTIDMTLRFWKRSSGGIYTSIGQIVVANQSPPTTRSIMTFPAVSMSSVSFSTGDKVYIDLWGFGHNWGSCGTGLNASPVIYNTYVSTSASAGVANDMQITSPGFI